MNTNSPITSASGCDLVSLIDLLLISLDDLAKAGSIDRACRLAGSAYVALRHCESRQAERFNRFLHRWATANESESLSTPCISTSSTRHFHSQLAKLPTPIATAPAATFEGDQQN